MSVVDVADDPPWHRLRELLDSKLREAIALGMTDERDIAEWVGAELWDELDAPESRLLHLSALAAPWFWRPPGSIPVRPKPERAW